MKINKRGFTLIELLVVVLIIGILVTIALPMYNAAIMKSRAAEMFQNLRSLYSAQELFYLQNDRYTDKFAQLDVQMPATTVLKDGAAIMTSSGIYYEIVKNAAEQIYFIANYPGDPQSNGSYQMR
jgi:prepilin-type N-terminal cleavage/methylation domain-containing protein